MKDYRVIRGAVEGMLRTKRFRHTINVEKEGIRLARIYDEREDKVRIAAILHDIAKEFSSEELLKYAKAYEIPIDMIQYSFPELLHGPVGAAFSKEHFSIEDEDILNAICYHTTGRASMSKLEKIIYLADLIEESRSFHGIEAIRKAAEKDLDKALVLACNGTIKYIIENNNLIHPLTIEFRNSLLLRGMHFNE